MHGNQFSIDNNDNVVPYEYHDTPMTIQATQQQINAILSGRTTATATASSIMAFTNQAKRKYDEFFPPNKNDDYIIPVLSPSSTSMYTKNDDHNACLYHRWNRSNKNTNNTDTTKPAPTITLRITTPLLHTKQPMHPSKNRSRMTRLLLQHSRLFVPLTLAPCTKNLYQ